MSDFSTVAMIGCGSMGGGMALLFVEIGVHISMSDPSEEAMDAAIDKANKSNYNDKVRKYNDYDSLCKSLSTPRLLVFSLPHGGVGDKVLEGLLPNLARNDIILDCSKEHFANTERRQEKVKNTGIRYIGCGVSGGYQAARAGPSMCPGGDQSALNDVLPLLQKVAAKDKNDKACVGYVGKGGSGHYVKMADYISDELLAPILKPNPSSDNLNLSSSPRIAEDIRKCFPALRCVVAKSVETDQVTPAISATLEYFKVTSGTDLPTSFYEAELDYFGSHMFDKHGDTDKEVKKPMEGKHHFEWKPATSQKEEYGKNY